MISFGEGTGALQLQVMEAVGVISPSGVRQQYRSRTARVARYFGNITPRPRARCAGRTATAGDAVIPHDVLEPCGLSPGIEQALRRGEPRSSLYCKSTWPAAACGIRMSPGSSGGRVRIASVETLSHAMTMKKAGNEEGFPQFNHPL